MATVTRNGVGYKVINARYAGTCGDCKVKVLPGERILWAPGMKGIRHAECKASVVSAKEKLAKGYAELASLTNVVRDWCQERGWCLECRGAGVVLKQLNFSDTLDYSDWREVYATCVSVPAEKDTRRSGLTSDRGEAPQPPSDCRCGAIPADFFKAAKLIAQQYGVNLPFWAQPEQVYRAPEGTVSKDRRAGRLEVKTWQGIEERPLFGYVTEFSDLGLRVGHIPNAIVAHGIVFHLDSPRYSERQVNAVVYRGGGETLIVYND